MKINSKLLTNSLEKNPDLQQRCKIFSMENFVNFPALIKLDIDSAVEEPCVENLSSFL